MLDWLTPVDSLDAPVTPSSLAVRMLAALAAGLVVAGVYRVSHGRTKDDAKVLFATLVLLSVLIAMVSMVIGNSVARAFSLVGALSIVRFRTVVDDTRDTAFVIFAVVVGMAVGAGLYLVPLVGVPIVAVAAIALSWFGPGARESTQERSTDEAEYEVTIRLGLGRDPEQLLRREFDQHLTGLRLRSASTAKQGTALEVVYRARRSPGGNLPALVSQLNQLDGVQSVEAREV